MIDEAGSILKLIVYIACILYVNCRWHVYVIVFICRSILPFERICVILYSAVILTQWYYMWTG